MLLVNSKICCQALNKFYMYMFQIPWNTPLCPELGVQFIYYCVNTIRNAIFHRYGRKISRGLFGLVHRYLNLLRHPLSPPISSERTDTFMSWTKIITISANAAQAKGFDLTAYPQVLLMSLHLTRSTEEFSAPPASFFVFLHAITTYRTFIVMGFALDKPCGSGFCLIFANPSVVGRCLNTFGCQPNPCLGAEQGIRTPTSSLEGWHASR